MKKFTLLFAILILSSFKTNQNDWEKINLGSWGAINLPTSMEVQSGNYKKMVDEMKKEFSINADRIVFQQKGVNEGKNLNTYARVIIRTDYGTEILPNLNTEILTQKDLNDLNSMYYSEVQDFARNPKFPSKIVKFNKVKITLLNGNKCINYSYIREMGTNPQTISEFYIFWKGKNQHSLNIEYRIKDFEKWKADLNKCLASFKFKK